MNQPEKVGKVKVLVNVGCGHLLHSGWINLDRVETKPGVIVCDLDKGLPFPDGYADAVYHSNVLEHFSKTSGRALVRECVRVLKPGGVLRITIPDLKAIALEYLAALDRVRRGNQGAADEHEWMTIELMDQMVRSESGGTMRQWLDERPMRAERFVKSRIGLETPAGASAQVSSGQSKSQNASPSTFAKMLQALREPYRIREFLLKVLLGKEYRTLRVGRFRLSGEVHQWMYDEVTLWGVMREVGLANVGRVGWRESRIEGWETFKLEDDTPALRMEGVKLE